MSSDRLVRDEAAALAGVRPDTWSAYVSRGQAPAPVEYVGRTPLWAAGEVKAWTASRPGRGRRKKSESPVKASPEQRGDQLDLEA